MAHILLFDFILSHFQIVSMALQFFVGQNVIMMHYIQRFSTSPCWPAILEEDQTVIGDGNEKKNSKEMKELGLNFI